MNSAGDIWTGILQILENKLTTTAIATWFSDCRAIDIKDDRFVIYVPTRFKRDIIASMYSEIIKEALREIFGGNIELLILCESELDSYTDEADKTEVRDIFNSSQFTFERFIVGGSNKFAHAAAIAVAQNPAGAYNPLFIYGDSGLGKTHLLYAIGQYIKSRNPNFNIVYIIGDDLANELITSIRSNQNFEFREKYRGADLLLVDDIQFIAGKTQTQEEFFHTFNALYEAGKQIVLTSDRPPREILTLEDRLKSRFEWGLLADIQPPDFETRVAIVKNKAQRLGVILPDKIALRIAESITTNIRQLEGAVKKVTAFKDLSNAEIDMDLVERSIKDIIRLNEEFTPELIIEKTASYYGIPASDVTGKSRAKNTATTRQISMYLIRKLMNMPLLDIGKYFGNKDHSTVLHSIRKIENSIASSVELANVIKDITANITYRE